MKTSLSIAVAVLVFTVPSSAGSKKKVDLADLATLDSRARQTLVEGDRAVSDARIDFEAARDAEARAKRALKAAEKELDAQQADKKAADAELKAAKKNEDPGRTERASALVEKTANELGVARQLLRWKKQAVVAADARTKASKALLELSQARLDADRVRMISEAGSAPTDKYDLTKFDGKVRSLQSGHERSAARAQSAAAKAEQLRLSWRAAATPADHDRFDPASRSTPTDR